MNNKFHTKQRIRGLKAIICLIAGMVVIAFGKEGITFAGGQAYPSAQALQHIFEITQLDTTHFPQVDVYVSGANLGAPLDNQTRLVLKEDGLPKEVSAQQIRPVGVQVAFVLHHSGGSVADDDDMPIAKTLKRLVASGVLSEQTDWLAAFTTTDSGYADVLQPWNQRHSQMPNAFNRVSFSKQAEKTTLFDSLNYVLDQFRETDIPDNLFKSIVLFADGASDTDTLSIEDVIEKSTRYQTVIHVVQLGKPSPAAQSTLSRLAARTGGHYVVLDDPNDLDSLWNLLGLQRHQLVVSYRTGQARPSTLSIVVDVNGNQFEASHLFPVMHLKPAAIAVTSVEPVSTDDGQSMVQLDMAIDWPDGYARQLKRVECIACQTGGQNLVYTELPFDHILIPADTLPAGADSISLLAIDELGIEATVTPSRIPLDGMVAGGGGGAFWIWAISIVVLVGGGVGLVIWQRRKPAPPVLWEQRPIMAWLRHDNKDKYPIRRGRNLIGRGRKVDIAINDDSKVSRSHCCIVEDNGHFSLEDKEAKNPVFVNGTKLEKNKSRPLYNGNKIKIGSRYYTFEIGEKLKPLEEEKPYNSTLDLINQ